jgi:translation initiation factor 4G
MNIPGLGRQPGNGSAVPQQFSNYQSGNVFVQQPMPNMAMSGRPIMQQMQRPYPPPPDQMMRPVQGMYNGQQQQVVDQLTHPPPQLVQVPSMDYHLVGMDPAGAPRYRMSQPAVFTPNMSQLPPQNMVVRQQWTTASGVPSLPRAYAGLPTQLGPPPTAYVAHMLQRPPQMMHPSRPDTDAGDASAVDAANRMMPTTGYTPQVRGSGPPFLMQRPGLMTETQHPVPQPVDGGMPMRTWPIQSQPSTTYVGDAGGQMRPAVLMRQAAPSQPPPQAGIRPPLLPPHLNTASPAFVPGVGSNQVLPRGGFPPEMMGARIVQRYSGMQPAVPDPSANQQQQPNYFSQNPAGPAAGQYYAQSQIQQQQQQAYLMSQMRAPTPDVAQSYVPYAHTPAETYEQSTPLDDSGYSSAAGSQNFNYEQYMNQSQTQSAPYSGYQPQSLPYAGYEDSSVAAANAVNRMTPDLVRHSRAIKIVDPNTGEEVKANSTPTGEQDMKKGFISDTSPRVPALITDPKTGLNVLTGAAPSVDHMHEAVDVKFNVSVEARPTSVSPPAQPLPDVAASTLRQPLTMTSASSLLSTSDTDQAAVEYLTSCVEPPDESTITGKSSPTDTASATTCILPKTVAMTPMTSTSSDLQDGVAGGVTAAYGSESTSLAVSDTDSGFIRDIDETGSQEANEASLSEGQQEMQRMHGSSDNLSLALSTVASQDDTESTDTLVDIVQNTETSELVDSTVKDGAAPENGSCSNVNMSVNEGIKLAGYEMTGSPQSDTTVPTDVDESTTTDVMSFSADNEEEDEDIAVVTSVVPLDLQRLSEDEAGGTGTVAAATIVEQPEFLEQTTISEDVTSGSPDEPSLRPSMIPGGCAEISGAAIEGEKVKEIEQPDKEELELKRETVEDQTALVIRDASTDADAAAAGAVDESDGPKVAFTFGDDEQDEFRDAEGNGIAAEQQSQQKNDGDNAPSGALDHRTGDQKLRYDRDFLLKLRTCEESQRKPDGLPPLPEIYIDMAQPQPNPYFAAISQNIGRYHGSSPSMLNYQAPPNDFAPDFVCMPPMGGGGVRGMNSSISFNRRGSNQRRPPERVINVSLHDVQLHTTDNAWKPVILRPQDAADEDMEKTELLYKKFRGILNKLTPEKFETLLQKVHELTIDTEDRLDGCIAIIFEKAISEPGFSVQYAKLAHALINIQVPLKERPTETINFRKLLLNRCQKEFEKDKQEEIDIERRQKQIEETTSEEEKKILMADKEEAVTKSRRRSLGNIRFIGELFKLKMLTEKIMFECVFKLLTAADYDSLECLCRLLTTVGKDLDYDKTKSTLDQCFHRINKFARDKNVVNRIRFMLQDVIELRNSKWVPRRVDNKPKTIDQIHKEAKEEEQQRQVMIRSAPPPPATVMSGAPQRRQKHDDGVTAVDDGWKMATNKTRNTFDPSRMKINVTKDAESIQLGPAGRPGGALSWQKGSSGGGAVTGLGMKDDVEVVLAPSNRYTPLGSGSADAQKNRGARGVRSVHQNAASPTRASQFASSTPHSRLRNLPPRLLDKELARNKNPAGDMVPRRSPTMDAYLPSEAAARSSPTSVDEQVPEVTVKPDERQFSDADIRRKTKCLLEEYFETKDVSEAIERIRELGVPMPLFIHHAVNCVMEKTSGACKATGVLCYKLAVENLLMVEDYVRGLQSILEDADDMSIDIPKIWQYLGEFIAPMLQHAGLSFVASACRQLVVPERVPVFVDEVLKSASELLGYNEVQRLWTKSAHEFSDLLSNEPSFITSQKSESISADDRQQSSED